MTPKHSKPPGRQQHQFPYLFDDDPSEGHPIPDELVRFGVQFADGRKATTLTGATSPTEKRRPRRC